MEFKIIPWGHQKFSINRVIKEKRDFYGLLHDMGAGKTATSINIYRAKCYENKCHLKLTIICPIAVMHNWKREILTHSNIYENSISVVDGITKASGKKIKAPSKRLKIEQLIKPTPIKIINTDLVNSDLFDYIEECEFLIVDESHKFKTPNSKRTKKLHEFTRVINPKYRLILTGSPVLQNAMDLWAQFYILDPNILGYNFFSFRSEYFYDKNAGMPKHIHFPNWCIKPDAADKLYKIIYEHADRVLKSDVLDLPPMIYQTAEVMLSTEQRRMYNDMRDELVTFLEGDLKALESEDSLEGLPDTMSADLAIVKVLRLQQIINGIFISDKGEVKILNCERPKVLKDLLEEICSNKENQVIVWSIFTATYGIIAEVCEKLGISHVFLNGLQNAEEKQNAIDDFNSKKAQVIIANQAAGGTGVNLTAANYSIYYSRSFNLEHDLQSEARNYRGGQNRNVTRIDLVTPDTIDEKIIEALQVKKEAAEDILAAKDKEFSRKEILKMI